ncbi:hypothetical protein NDU88_000846, partial [Pleurodeles waltl]
RLWANFEVRIESVTSPVRSAIRGAKKAASDDRFSITPFKTQNASAPPLHRALPPTAQRRLEFPRAPGAKEAGAEVTRSGKRLRFAQGPNLRRRVRNR